MMTTRMIGSLPCWRCWRDAGGVPWINQAGRADSGSAGADGHGALSALEAQSADGRAIGAGERQRVGSRRPGRRRANSTATMAVLPVALLILLVVGRGVAGTSCWCSGIARKRTLIVVQAQAVRCCRRCHRPPRMLSNAQLPGPVAARA